ncbi:hypothetical protein AAG570_012167 [Ranatra chinensis]|uniref:Uncharacterized protein n=1 Tax=Ranatra chinensis TaxID=642074 RepID=A0ABD0YIB1_9HEMI
MASKRGNMFYQNKKQETTEIGKQRARFSWWSSRLGERFPLYGLPFVLWGVAQPPGCVYPPHSSKEAPQNMFGRLDAIFTLDRLRVITVQLTGVDQGVQAPKHVLPEQGNKYVYFERVRKRGYGVLEGGVDEAGATGQSSARRRPRYDGSSGHLFLSVDWLMSYRDTMRCSPCVVLLVSAAILGTAPASACLYGCICFKTTVRCMQLYLETIPPIPDNTTVLYFDGVLSLPESKVSVVSQYLGDDSNMRKETS